MEQAVIKTAEPSSGFVARERKNVAQDSPIYERSPAPGETRDRPLREGKTAGGAPASPAPPPAAQPLLKLQQTIGNQAVGRLLRPQIQFKRRTAGGDEAEHEADRAGEVISSGGVLDPALASALSLARLRNAPPAVQRAPADADDAPEPAASAKPLAAPLIVDDDVDEPGPGQMQRSEFLERLEKAVIATVTDGLAGTGRTPKDCPYLAHWFEWAENQSSTRIERGIRIYAPETHTVQRALDYIAPICERITHAIRVWLKTGEVTGVPKDAASSPAAPEEKTDPKAAVQTKALPDGACTADPAQIQAQLGAGQPLDGAVQTRMESAFGHQFSAVRVHIDGNAAGLAEQLNARAFTVAGDIAFAHGEFRPGTPAGDALLAHELAHVVQQGAGVSSAAPLRKGGSPSEALEKDADTAAAGAVASLWGRGMDIWSDLAANAMPRLRSGLSLQRCSGATIDPSLLPTPPDYDTVVKDLQTLYLKKERILAGQISSSQLDDVNSQIDAEIANLRLLGITLDEDQIYDRVMAGRNLRVIEASIERIPATQAYFGQRVQFILHTNYLPPEKNAKVEWRWQADKTDKFEYDFFSFPHGYQFELEETFWTLMPPPAIIKAKGMEVIAHIYLGDDKTPAATAKTGWISFSDTVPDALEIGASQEVAVPNGPVTFRIKNWAPDQFTTAIDWYVDGKLVQPNFYVYTHKFDTTGTKTVTAKVYRFERGQGRDHAWLAKEASTTIDVQDELSVGTSVLAETAKLGPLERLSGLEASIKSSMKEIAAHAALGGEREAYYAEVYEAQEKLLKSINEHVPDFKETKNLPDDPTTLAPGAYSAPIPTVVVYPARDGVQPVKAYLVVRGSGSNWTAFLIDITGSKVEKFPEATGDKPLAAMDAAFANWESDNPYHTGGTLVYTFNPTGWKRANHFSTYATGKRVWEYIDGILQVGGIVIGILLLAAPDPSGLTKLLGWAFLALSIAASVHSIYRNLKLGGGFLDKENLIEGLNIITALLGLGGGWMRSLGQVERNVRPLLFRIGNVAIITSAAADVGTLVYATDQALNQLRAVQGDPTLNDAQRWAEMTRIVSSLFMSAAMVVVSNKGLFKGGFSKGDFIKERIGEGAAKISQGTRLDLELELRKQGFDPKELRKLPDNELLNQHFKVQQRLAATSKLERIRMRLSGKALTEFDRMAAETGRPEDLSGILEDKPDPQAFLEAHANDREAAAKKAADEQKEAEKGKGAPATPPTAAKPTKHNEWIDQLRKIDPSSDVKLAPMKSVGTPVEGIAEVAPEAVIRINDAIDIHPDRLAEISPGDLKNLLTATRALKEKGGDFSKLDKADQKILNGLSATRSYRLRFEFQRQRSDQFLTELGIADRPIFENMTNADRNRIYDLLSNKPDLDPSKGIIGQVAPKGAPDLPRQAADYALSRKPSSAAEFVNHYEFYMKQFGAAAEARITAFDKSVADAISAWEAKNGAASKSQRDSIQTEVAKKAGVTGKVKDFYYGEQQKQMQASAATPGVVNDEGRKSVGAVYDELAKDIGGRVGGSKIEANLPRDQVVQKLRTLPDIQFGSESAAAYHTEKHFDEIPAAERAGTKYDAYINSARKTIRDPASKIIPVSTQEGGANSYKFERTMGDGTVMTAIVIVTSDGKVVLATYMGIKP